ncbi:hypothetical protein GCM10010401_09890 [Rarobacter faecitabidus]|uniref:Large subunit ribosomal protein L7/L12 n=1 Tax=Rarobacter faecitabidus TaxID=13243 RepID=A0A542ZA17_RARFA|nr:ribosomal protein L7/L12 [Rarobacter faecitabidus]TQL57187.1 large subunit ribosomal protein L7/L12 [Rarobacter faecitabidus]
MENFCDDGAMGFFNSSPESALDHRVAELERRVRELEVVVAQLGRATENSSISPVTSQYSPAQPTSPADIPGQVRVSEEVRALAASGKKINAIKVLREQSGLGLKEAKEVVDRL